MYGKNAKNKLENKILINFFIVIQVWLWAN